MKIPAEVRLDIRVPVVAKVWIEKREGKFPETAALAEALGVPAPLHFPYLCWDRGARKGNWINPEKAYIKLAEIGLTSDIKGFLCDYYQTVGPLFNQQELLLSYILHHVWLAAALTVLEDSISPFQVPGLACWFPQGILDGEAPQTKARYWTWVSLSVPKADGTGQEVSIYPQFLSAPVRWPVFRMPETRLSTREENISYLCKELWRNALSRLKHITPIFNNKEIIIRPDCLYNAILLMVHLHYNRFRKPRAKKEITTKTKQDTIAVFRSRKNRGTISGGAYEKAKKAINLAWEAGQCDKEDLIQVGEKAVSKHRRKKED